MAFYYIGAYPDGKSDITAYGGYVFSDGVSVDLPEPMASKARGNRFFVEVFRVTSVGESDVAPVPEPVVVSVEPVTSVLGPVPPLNAADYSKIDLVDMAARCGVAIDGRWAKERIAQAIIDAANAIATNQPNGEQ